MHQNGLKLVQIYWYLMKTYYEPIASSHRLLIYKGKFRKQKLNTNSSKNVSKNTSQQTQ